MNSLSPNGSALTLTAEFPFIRRTLVDPGLLLLQYLLVRSGGAQR